MDTENTSLARNLRAPKILHNDMVKIPITFFDFEGKEQQGVIEVHRSIQKEIEDIFHFIKKQKFPLHCVRPMEEFDNDDDRSMSANNSSAFCFRTVTLKPNEISLHGYGLAIDINPLQNPYINEDTILPSDAVYDIQKPGTLFANHPLVKYFKDRGFVWGGDWEKPYLDYQHFHKEVSHELREKYFEAVSELFHPKEKDLGLR